MLFRSLAVAASGVVLASAVDPIDVAAICDVPGAITIGSGSGDAFADLDAAWISQSWPEGTVFLLRDETHWIASAITLNVPGVKICGTSRTGTILKAEGATHAFELMADNIGFHRLTISHRNYLNTGKAAIGGDLNDRLIKNFQMSQVDFEISQQYGMTLYAENARIEDNLFLSTSTFFSSSMGVVIALTGSLGDNRIVNNRFASEILPTSQVEFVRVYSPSSFTQTYVKGSLTVNGNEHITSDSQPGFGAFMQFLNMRMFRVESATDRISLVVENNVVPAGKGFVFIITTNDDEGLILDGITLGGNQVSEYDKKCLVTLFKAMAGTFRTGSDLSLALTAPNTILDTSGNPAALQDVNGDFFECTGSMDASVCRYKELTPASTIVHLVNLNGAASGSFIAALAALAIAIIAH